MWPPIPPMQFNTNYFHQPPSATTSRRRTFESSEMAIEEHPSSSSAAKRTRINWENSHLPQPPSLFSSGSILNIPNGSNSGQFSPASNRSIHQQTALNVMSPTIMQQNNFSPTNNNQVTSSHTPSPSKPLFDIFQRKTPPKQPKNDMDVETTPSPSQQNHHQNTPQAQQQCWSCLKSWLIQPSLQLTACKYCEHQCCVETCLTHCEQCYHLYCVRCYMTDYSNQICERKLCVDCYYYNQ